MIAGTTVQISILRRLSLAVLALISCSTPLAAQTLTWSANTESNLAGYRVQYGTSSSTFTTTVNVGNVTSWRISGPPAGVAHYYRVVAYNSSGQVSAPSQTISYTLPATTTSPTLSSVSPTSGPTSGGTTITLTGTNFVSGATVRVGGVAATNVVFSSSTRLTARTPAGTAGAKTVEVRNPNGATATRASAFTYTTSSPSPTTLSVTGVSPSSGPRTGGTTITVTGSGFVSGARVSVGTLVAGNVVFVSSTQLRATTPYSSTTGARDVRVTNPNNQYAIRSGGFTYTTSTSSPSPTPTPSSLTVSGVSPSSGPRTGGTTITVTGSGFVSGARVSVGTLVASNVVFVSSTQLRATTPYSSTTGARDVRVTNPNNQYAIRSGGFTYTTSTTSPSPTPSSLTVSGVSPASGPRTGGTTITVNGSGFVSGARVSVGTLVASNVVFVSSTQLRARTPYSSTTGARDVRVTNPNGQYAIRSGGFTYLNSTTSTSTLTSASSGTFTSYLAEGVQTDQMNTQLAIANPEATDAQVNLTFMDATGASSSVAVDVPARSRQTVDLSTQPQLAGQTFSTRVDADQPVAVDRLVSLDAEGQSASLESAVSAASATWYFAEGSTVDPMELFYLVQNPGTTPARVQVRYLRAEGQSPVTKTYEIAAGSRSTIWVDREDPALAAADVAAEITSLDGTPIVVERSLYLKEPGATQPRGGDTSAGLTAPATQWFVEAATGAYTTRLLLANPGSQAAEVRATFQREDGRRVARSYAVPAGSRQSIDVAAQDPALADAKLGITVESNQPIVVERSKWWGADGSVDEAVSGGGTTRAGARWLLAEAEQGGARQAATDVVVFNHGAATEVTVTLLFEGAPETSATFPVAAGARFAVPLAEAFPGADGRRFSVLVEAADPAATLTVDRAIFWQGATRTAGADGAAQPLR